MVCRSGVFDAGEVRGCEKSTPFGFGAFLAVQHASAGQRLPERGQGEDTGLGFGEHPRISGPREFVTLDR